ncbi:cardiolipin synthase [Enterovibrio norvegicus FF-33]|uniref:Cardiolipin synthase A n=1 Tax=Enterovibrio norvegicus FF-454 TaxID=1185651 RepID=A0A1E5C0L7_9GAMM|nr:cardiolipin synthase [Enterovibrio norvegicus]OEE59066.1 cardiolipin synthase [Enterovibrio norvegicus FF-454]OEE67776.1 cardiolipin synthase [Enterovibrio norvegicus FF-33]OEE74768.1 cardiolipin synthase [Enterovibrio norvegicus FF-162]
MEQIYQILVWASVFLYWLLIAGVTIRVVLKRRALGVSIAWLMIIYIIPIVGVILYLLFGELNLGRKRAERAKAMFTPYLSWLETLNECEAHRPHHHSFLARPVHDLCLRRAGIPALAGNQLSLLSETADILRNIALDVQKAESSINMVFYIWHPGGHADDVANAVCAAARRGVTVRILLDSAGSKAFFRSHWPDAMRQAGVELIEALAVSPARMFLRRLDIRQHRKVVIIDNKIGYTGSMNLVDPRFFKQNAGVGQWVDIMVKVDGPSVPILNSIFAWDWEFETGLRYLPDLPECSLIEQHQHANHSVQVAPSGPGMPDGIIQQVLMLAIHQAKKSLTITTPYLVPSESLLSALQTTAQRGVTVNIIIPAKNDSLMVDWASRSFFNDLLRTGINIYRFNGGLLHTKSVMVDDNFCLMGTVNLDMRSLWLNFELTLCVDDPDFCEDMLALQQSYIEDSTSVSLAEWSKRSIINRPIEQFFYMFSPLL